MSIARISTEDLQAIIKEAYQNIEAPDEANIISHNCPECRAVLKVFRNESWETIDPRKVEWGFDKLPLFTPKALHYFLPVFLLYSVREPSSHVCQFTVYTLTPDEDDVWWRERLQAIPKPVDN